MLNPIILGTTVDADGSYAVYVKVRQLLSNGHFDSAEGAVPTGLKQFLILGSESIIRDFQDVIIYKLSS